MPARNKTCFLLRKLKLSKPSNYIIIMYTYFVFSAKIQTHDNKVYTARYTHRYTSYDFTLSLCTSMTSYTCASTYLSSDACTKANTQFMAVLLFVQLLTVFSPAQIATVRASDCDESKIYFKLHYRTLSALKNDRNHRV